MIVFDDKANDYDQWYKSKLGSFVDKVETELAFSLFKPTSGMKILDVGCGTGNFSIKLAEMGCKVIGIDLSEKMINKAKEKIKNTNLDIEFYAMDVYDIDFPDESFDGVFSMAVFEFINKPLIAYNEMYRVLKENGYLLIGTINKESKWGEFYIAKSLKENSIYKYADFKSIEDLKSWNTKEVIDYGECLFIPVDTKEGDLSIELEAHFSSSEQGGFICMLWKKQTNIL